MSCWKPGSRGILFASLLALFVPGATPAVAQVLRFSTENDLLTDRARRDDLYTFSLSLEIERKGWALSLRENAFTDRAAGVRFDETYLSLGRSLGDFGPWNLGGEVGLVHRGHGLFGERVQNTVHRAIGGDEVELDYLGSGLHARLALVAERRFAAGPRLDWGPRLEADVVPGLRSWALVAATVTWRPSPLVAVEALAGGRFTDASYAALEPHLESRTLAAEIGVVFAERYFLSWSYGDFGEKREHLAAGYRLPFGERARRD